MVLHISVALFEIGGKLRPSGKCGLVVKSEWKKEIANNMEMVTC